MPPQPTPARRRKSFLTIAPKPVLDPETGISLALDLTVWRFVDSATFDPIYTGHPVTAEIELLVKQTTRIEADRPICLPLWETIDSYNAAHLETLLAPRRN